MFKKFKLNRKIKRYRGQIAFLEQKRSRSQAALVEAILRHTTPDDADVDYFNMYSEKIDKTRNEMHELQFQLKNL